MQTLETVTFDQLALSEPLKRALREKGYTHPSPIQAQAIPHLLQGRDLIGLAQTGTGKTAAFALPMLHLLDADWHPARPCRPRALVLTPTRELAIQVGENIARYGAQLRLRHALVFGGVGEQPQIRALQNGVDIVVATPGRLLDLIHQRHAQLDSIEIFVLDEADRMLDMGFAPDVKRIIARLPQRRQSLLFSATMPEGIRAIASTLLHDPVTVEVARVGTTAERVEQKVCFVPRGHKHRLLLHYLEAARNERVLVFARTKRGADRLAKALKRDGVDADAIHGDKGQGARQRALKNFASGEVPVLVATDIAARGIDVKEIGLVVNYELPEEPESYVHRIGRTARAGASGLAIAFCDAEEMSRLRDIQRLIRADIPVEKNHPFVDAAEQQLSQHESRPQGGRSRSGRPGFVSTAGPGRGRPGRAPRPSGSTHSRPAQAESASSAPKRRNWGGFRNQGSGA